MKSLTASLLIAAAAGAAHAQLTVDVVGNPGDGFTTWTFGGSSTARQEGATSDPSNNIFNSQDTGQFPFGQDTILDTTLQDAIFFLDGDVTMTVGANSQLIAAVYIDDDGAQADDFGVRTDTRLAWNFGDPSSWSGTATVGVDITAFALGATDLSGTQPFFAEQVDFTFAVPAPGAAAAFAAAGLVAVRRRRR